MSYRRTSSQTLLNSRKHLYNPQSVYTHMEKMLNLLQQYDTENSYLNKQVVELLDQKRKIENKINFIEYEKNSRRKFQQMSRNNEYELASGTKDYNRGQSTNKKKRYEYIDENERDQNPILNQNSQPKPFTPYYEKNQNKYAYLNENRSSPEATSRFLSEEQLRKQNELTLNKDVYIGSPYNDSTSRRSSGQRRQNSPGMSESKLSGRSRKSKIEVVSKLSAHQQKIEQQEVDANRISEKNLEQGRKQVSPSKSQKRVSFTDETNIKITQSLSKASPKEPLGVSQPIKQDLKQSVVKNNIKYVPITSMRAENNEQKASFSHSRLGTNKNERITHIAERRSSAVMETGVNIQSNYYDRGLTRNRSLNHHRIQPSQKIVYPERATLNRKQSQPNLRGQSREGKKKFISIVSNLMLKQKLGQKDKPNLVYK